MNSLSPMIKRIKSQKQGKILKFLPRKGRIRFFLVIATLIFIIWTIPSFTSKTLLNTTVSADNSNFSDVPFEKDTTLFLQEIVTTIIRDTTLLFTSPIRINKEEDSFLVWTTIDTQLQKYISKQFLIYQPLYGAFVAMDPSTGRILSLVSYVKDSLSKPEKNLCLTAFFPAASVYKTITAAAAIEYLNYNADCYVEHRGKNHTLYHSQLKEKLDYIIELSMSEIYARSINAAFARIALYGLGTANILDYSYKFGFETPIPGDLPCDKSKIFIPNSPFELAELSSGFNKRTTISPLHGALISSCIAEDGIMPVPIFIDSITQLKDGKCVYRADYKKWKTPISIATAQELQKMMKSVVTYGTASKQFKSIKTSKLFADYLYGGKTGSIDKDSIGRVDWFVGFAKHTIEPNKKIALGILTVHGEIWTVHSSYLAAESIKFYISSLNKKEKKSITLNQRDSLTTSEN